MVNSLPLFAGTFVFGQLFCSKSIYALHVFFHLTDSNIWEELLHLSEGCFLPADEECCEVSL